MIEWMTQGQAMELRKNVPQYNRFVSRQQSPFLWGNPGPMYLVLLDFIAGQLADEIQVDFEIFKILYWLNYLDFHFVDISTIKSK